jgi:hypothetical protein
MGTPTSRPLTVSSQGDKSYESYVGTDEVQLCHTGLTFLGNIPFIT